MKIRWLAFLLVLCILAAGHAHAQAWEDVNPAAAGWSVEKLEAAGRNLDRLSRQRS